VRTAQAAAQRQRQVRRAARSWHRAGWIDAETLARIERRHADDRRRQSPALRTLLGLFGAFALASGFVLLRLLTGIETLSAGSFFLEAIVCVALAEWQFGRLRIDGFGTETAAALFGYGSFVVASGSLLFDNGFERFGWLASAASLAGFAGAWRWGSVTLASAGAIAAFAALARLPGGRLFWIVSALLVLAAGWRVRRDPRPAPAHRLGAGFVFCVAAAAMLVAVHPWTNDAVVERVLFGHANSTRFVLPSSAAWAATLLLAATLCTLGIRRRDRLALVAGLAATSVFVVTAAIELRPRPLWLFLTIAGGLLVAATIAIGRWIDRGSRRERGGWTTDLLAEAGATAPIETIAALATASMASSSISSTPGEENPPVRGDGGEFGGGGASGSY
jgi:hypothetical protein